MRPDGCFPSGQGRLKERRRDKNSGKTGERTSTGPSTGTGTRRGAGTSTGTRESSNLIVKFAPVPFLAVGEIS